MTLLFFGTLRSERSVQRIEICPSVFRKTEGLFCATKTPGYAGRVPKGYAYEKKKGTSNDIIEIRSANLL